MGAKTSKTEIKTTEVSREKRVTQSSKKGLEHFYVSQSSCEHVGAKPDPRFKPDPHLIQDSRKLAGDEPRQRVQGRGVPESTRPKAPPHATWGDTGATDERTDECVRCVGLRDGAVSGASSAGAPRTAEAPQDDVCLEELAEAVATLQHLVLQLDHKCPEDDNLYIQQACRTLKHSVNLLKRQTPTTKDASRCVGGPEAVERTRRKGRGPESIDSTSSKFLSLTNQISTSLLLRLITKLSKKNRKRVQETDMETILTRLTGLVAAELDACDCDLLRVEENVADITKSMVRNLLRSFGSSESLLRAAMSPHNQAFDKAVLSFLRGKLNVSRKTAVSKFFSGISRRFRR